jgi:sulfite reductase beta subunit-like hemoprotein
MQRVKVPQGRIRPDAFRALAALAERYTPGYPLHLTTRQDVELHGVLPDDVPAIQRGIDEAGLTSVAACGDSLRNVVVCPANGLEAGSWDVAEVAGSIERFAESLPWIRDLPRKFKVSVSGCPNACARPWINDLGLVANADGTMRAVMAGSLGARPDLGVLLYDALRPGEILPLVSAALKLFHAEGDRQRRGRARLRHVRQRLGEARFRSRMESLVQEENRVLSTPEATLRRVEREVPLRARLSLPLGDLAPDAASELADAVQAAGAELRLGLQHDLFVYGDAPVGWSPRLQALANRPRVVACPGVTWCTRAIADSRAAAARTLETLPDRCEVNVAIAGCPNNCPQAAVADVGLIGCIRKTAAGERQECFRLLVGGGNGQSAILADEREPAVPADEVPEAIAQAIRQLRPDRQSTQCAPRRVNAP